MTADSLVGAWSIDAESGTSKCLTCLASSSPVSLVYDATLTGIVVFVLAIRSLRLSSTDEAATTTTTD